MSQLFGFPSGLSGGSKETSYNTSHSTSHTTNYNSSWSTFLRNTSWTTGWNTSQPTLHNTVYPTYKQTFNQGSNSGWTNVGNWGGNGNATGIKINFQLSWNSSGIVLSSIQRLSGGMVDSNASTEYGGFNHPGPDGTYPLGPSGNVTTFLNTYNVMGRPNYFNCIPYLKELALAAYNNDGSQLVSKGLLPAPDSGSIPVTSPSGNFHASGYQRYILQHSGNSVWNIGGGLNTSWKVCLNQGGYYDTAVNSIEDWYLNNWYGDFIEPVVTKAIRESWTYNSSIVPYSSRSDLVVKFIPHNQYDYVWMNQYRHYLGDQTQQYCPVTPGIYIYDPVPNWEHLLPGWAGGSNYGSYSNFLEVGRQSNGDFYITLMANTCGSNLFKQNVSSSSLTQTSLTTSRDTNKTTYWGTSRSTSRSTYINTSQGTSRSTSYTTNYPTSHITYG